MARTVETTCDYCGKNVDYSGRDGHFVIVLSCYQREGVPNMMLVHPPVDDKMYFCNMGCLHSWLDNERKPQNYAPQTTSSATTSVRANNDGSITVIGEYEDWTKTSAWISVDEYLPVFHVLVICFDGRNVQEGFLRDVDERWSRDDGQLIPDVTHWMPMPNPPK